MNAWDCAICLDRYCDPVVLTCGHTLCRDCVDALLTNRCPFCNQLVGHTTPNFALRDLVDLRNLEEASQCEEHQLPLAWYCFDCKKTVCADGALKEHRACQGLHNKEQATELLKETRRRVLSFQSHPYFQEQTLLWKRLSEEKERLVLSIQKECERLVELVESSFNDDLYRQHRKVFDCVPDCHYSATLSEVVAAAENVRWLERTVQGVLAKPGGLRNLTSFDRKPLLERLRCRSPARQRRVRVKKRRGPAEASHAERGPGTLTTAGAVPGAHTRVGTELGTAAERTPLFSCRGLSPLGFCV